MTVSASPPPGFTPPPVFGPMTSAVQLEDHVQATLERWLPTYIYHAERLHGITPGTLPLPRSWVRTSEIEKFPEDQLPCVIIGSPGLTDPPQADGAGHYSASFRMLIAVEVAAGPNRRALELARIYALALRATVLQQQQDPGLLGDSDIVRVDWIDERYDQLDSIDDRTVCVGGVSLNVTVAEAVQRNAGPIDPLIPPQPPDPNSPSWPTSVLVATDIDKIPISEEP